MFSRSHLLKRIVPAFFSILLLMAVSVANAADTEKTNATLDTLVVTASGFEQDIRDAPASISIITREELETQPFFNLADAVKDATGLNYVGGSGNEKDITIRGLPGEYTLILVDGKRVSTRESRPNGSGGFEASYIPPMEAIERIEVIRGPMSTLYGSDALGGVINIITRKSTDKWRLSVGLEHTFQEDRNSGDITNGSFFTSGPLYKDKLAIQLMGSANMRDEDDISSGYVENDNKNITSKLIYTPMEGQEFILEGGRTVQKRESTAGKASTSDSKSTHSRNNWGISHNALWEGFGWGGIMSKLNYYWDETERSSNSMVTTPTGRIQRKPTITNQVVDGQISLPLPMNMLTFGGQYQYSKLEDTNAQGSGIGTTVNMHTKIDAYQYALFIEDEFSILDNLALTVGVRMDDHEHFGEHWSPRAYLVWHPFFDLTLKGGVSKGFKTPSLRQLDPNYGYTTGGSGGNQIMYGNPDLEPETSVTQEIAAIYQNNYGLNLSLTVFQTDFKDKLTNNIMFNPDGTEAIDPATGRTLREYDNIGKARIQGVEASVTIPFLEDFKLGMNYTFLDSERLSDEEEFRDGTSTKGQPLTLTPRHSANARLDWQATPELSLYGRVEYTGKQTYVGSRTGWSGPRTRSEYTTFDLGGSYKINANTRISFAALNLTDEREEDLDDLSGTADWDVIQDGRRYWVGLNVDF
ncbi:TonB-dependent receptor [Desulfosarcina sp. OttesenSCG-928-A07]|nr:TonB-dependent receptor [Desulfosarcina sp. OttesenSCG-928-G17]MDL2328814.1 TonB-dependent receptor [Desulfosarcina sp. OttesenSCG-928-A07]